MVQPALFSRAPRSLRALKIPAFAKPIAFALLRAFPALERRVLPSAGYRIIDRAEAERLIALPSGWQRQSSAAWQQRAYEALLASARSGDVRADLRIAAEAVDATGLVESKLLEIGCGGGYHSEIFERFALSRPTYLGTDFSAEMIESARLRYPGADFEIADATALPYTDGQFDIVFDGVALMHILDFDAAISEMARVAKNYCIFHCVPVFEERETTYLSKYAYGEPVVETVFNRRDLEHKFEVHGLMIEQHWMAMNYDLSAVIGSKSHSRTYLCRKTSIGE